MIGKIVGIVYVVVGVIEVAFPEAAVAGDVELEYAWGQIAIVLETAIVNEATDSLAHELESWL